MAKTVQYKGLRIKAKHHKQYKNTFEVTIYRGKELLYLKLAESEIDALAEGFIYLQNNINLLLPEWKVRES